MRASFDESVSLASSLTRERVDFLSLSDDLGLDDSGLALSALRLLAFKSRREGVVVLFHTRQSLTSTGSDLCVELAHSVDS